MLSRFHIELRRDRVAAIAVAAFCWTAAKADQVIVWNPRTYLLDGRLVLTPTDDMIIWDGGIASRVGSSWIGNGWSNYPGGQGALTSRMLDTAPDHTPRRRIQIDTSRDCDAALLMWRNY